MIWVPSGSFRMGDLIGGGGANELPVREVRLSGYHLAATEVTQDQWQRLMGSQPGWFKGANLPIENVNWIEAMEFCHRLTQMERQRGRLKKGSAYSLPSEAQWEYACRAGSTGDFSGEFDEMAWCSFNSGGKTHPVATRKPNAWGFFDMYGNVWEWCWDKYADSYFGLAVLNPLGSKKGPDRVIRGGGWLSSPSISRSSARLKLAPNQRRHNRGFRVAIGPLDGGEGREW